jgi:hypothetical protein
VTADAEEAAAAADASEEAGERPPDSVHWPSLAYFASIAVFSVWACYVSFADRLTIPILDDWRVLDEFHAKSLVQWLFAEQNGHRLVFTFGLFALDYAFFDGRQDLLVVASFATASLAVGALYLAYRTERGLDTPAAKAAFGFAWFATFWAGGSYNFLWGLCQGNLMVALWLFVSLACLVRYVHPLEAPARRARLLVFAALAAFFATFSLGEGAATWVALIVVAIAARLPGRTVAVLVLGFTLTLAVYSIGLGATGKFSFATSAAVVLRPFDAIGYAGAFLGSAPARTAEGLGLVGPVALRGASSVLGVVGLLAFASYAAWLWRKPSRAGPRELTALGIMAFAVAAAALVTLGRLPRAPMEDAIAVRFLNWSAMFWMGAVLAIPSFVRGAGGSVIVVLLAVTSICMLPAVEQSRESVLMWQRGGSNASLGLMLGVRDPSFAKRMGVYVGLPLVTSAPDLVDQVSPGARLDRFHRVVERLRRERRSFFADPRADLPGADLLDHFTIVPPGRCRGGMAAPAPIMGSTPPAARVRGRVLERPESRAPLEVVIADAAGVIRGLGIGRASDGAQRALGIRWSGYLAAFDPSEQYTGYAVLGDGRSACRLRGSAE